MAVIGFSVSVAAAAVTGAAGGAGADSAVHWQKWQTPSGNIACKNLNEGVICEIREYSFAAPEWTGTQCRGKNLGVRLTANDREVICLMDTLFEPNLPVLQYNQFWLSTDNSTECLPSAAELRCSRGAHAFTLSKEQYRIG